MSPSACVSLPQQTRRGVIAVSAGPASFRVVINQSAAVGGNVSEGQQWHWAICNISETMSLQSVCE